MSSMIKRSNITIEAKLVPLMLVASTGICNLIGMWFLIARKSDESILGILYGKFSIYYIKCTLDLLDIAQGKGRRKDDNEIRKKKKKKIFFFFFKLFLIFFFFIILFFFHHIRFGLSHFFFY